MQARFANRLKRRIRDARFPLLKTIKNSDYDAAPDLAGQAFMNEKNIPVLLSFLLVNLKKIYC